jgi:hypothetical protein
VVWHERPDAGHRQRTQSRAATGQARPLPDTRAERLALPKAHNLSHAEFLELVLSDEVNRREPTSAARRARAAALDPEMGLEN